MSATPKLRRTALTPRCTSRTRKERSGPPEKQGQTTFFRGKRGLSLISLGYAYPRAFRRITCACDSLRRTALHPATDRGGIFRLRGAGSGLRLRLRRTGAVPAQPPRHHALALALAAVGARPVLVAGENPQGAARAGGRSTGSARSPSPPISPATSSRATAR